MSPSKLLNYSPEGKIDLITEALSIEPRNWTRAHVQVLPKHYLLKNISTFTLTKIWDDLPEPMKNDEEMQSHLPCLEHYNRDEDTIHIDGPPPSKLRCRGCIRERIKSMEERGKKDKDSSNSDSSFKDDKRTVILTSV